MSFRERLISFGDENGLSGVVASPATAKKAAPGILLFNAGIVHRIGAHRFNVKLARRLAARGLPSIRFDLSGLGDSAAARPGLALQARTTADIRAGVDALAAASKTDRFILIGMCSGADNGYRAALADERIVGLVLLDPYSYANRRAQIERAASKALDVDRWKRAIGRVVGAAEAPKDAALEPADNSRPYPPREEFGRDLAALAARGVDILICYTALVAEHLTRPEHFFETFSDFDFRGRIDVGVDPKVDHTYTELAAQDELFARIEAWLAACGV